MQKALTGPKHSLTFRNKYLAVVLSVAAFLLSSVSSFGQGAAPPGYAPKVFSFGNWYNRLRADSAVHIPNKAGLFKNDNDTTPQLFVFNDTLRMFANGTFRNVGGPGGGGGTNIFNSNGRIPNGVTRRLSGGDQAHLFFDSLFEFGINDSAGHVLLYVDPLNESISLKNYDGSNNNNTNLSVASGQIGLNALNGLLIGNAFGSIPSFLLKQQGGQGASSTLYWPILDFPAGDTLATRRDVRVASDLTAVLIQGDTSYQQDMNFTWDSRAAAYSAGFARTFMRVHPDSVNGFFDVGDNNGNRTNFYLIQSQKAVGIMADSGFVIGAFGNSKFTYIKTQSAQPAGGFQARLYLPNTSHFFDTLATLADVRAGGGGGGTTNGVGRDTVQSYSTGSTLTQGASTNFIQVNPSSVQSTLTITTLASGGTWHSSNDLYIIAGGTLTSGNPVITTLIVTAGSGLTLVQAITPTTINAGEVIRYHKVGTLLYRIN